MFQWFLKPKFYSKCYTYVKFTRMRLETIQKRRNAVQKMTKGDIAELLRAGLDCDAYRRAEEHVLEQNMASCYELIEHFIGCISDHLQDLTKQKDCPDECKEAVPSLMHAAAGVADLPELRHLRTLFTEKFGNSLEPYISKEFVEKLRRDSPTREMKIRLLHDVAQEFSIDWDGKALEQRLSRHPSLHEEGPKLNKTDDLVAEEKHTNEREYNASKGKERGIPSQGNKELNDETWWHQNSSSDDDDDESSTDMSSVDGRKACSSSIGSISEDEAEPKKPYSLVPPPYLKQKKNNNNKGEANAKKTTNPESPRNKEQSNQNARTYARGKSLPNEHTSAVEASKGHARAISLGHEMKGGTGNRVHPNLPDYDDLVAYLKSLRGR